MTTSNDSTTTNVPAVLALPDLSENLLFEVLEYLTLTDRRRTIGTCHTLWKQRHRLEHKLKNLHIQSANEVHGALLTRHLLMDRYGPVLSNLTNLVHLNVGSYGTDGLLYLLPTSACCGTLKSLSMVGSARVTDTGLMLMSRRRPSVTDIQSHGILNDQSYQAIRAAMVERSPHRSSPLSSLAHIDLTFCRKTTYEGTMWLRDGLPNLCCIRRVPSWMDGQFHTPFAPNGGVEIHTYWPDGTFNFTRDSQSNGFVVDLYPWDRVDDDGEDNDGDQEGLAYDYEAIDFVGDKLQYNDSNFRENVPEIMQYAYRPGVSLLRLPPEQGAEDATPCVLVAQYLNGLKPPGIRHWMEEVSSENIPIGQSRYYGVHNSVNGTGQKRSNEGGELIQTQDYDVFEDDPGGPRPVVMMTKMKVEPLHSQTTSLPAEGRESADFENLLPPESLVEACRRTCRNLHQFDYRALEGMEQELDIILKSRN